MAPAARRAVTPVSAFTADTRATAPAGRSRRVRGSCGAAASRAGADRVRSAPAAAIITSTS
eukprot:5926879-Pleurochrysis_carterae.AAC.1